MKIAFFRVAVAGAGWASYKTGGNIYQSGISHGLSILSSVLKNAGHEVYLVDLRSFLNVYQFEDVAKKLEYDAALLWLNPKDLELGQKISTMLKSSHPDKFHIAGGPLVSSCEISEGWAGVDLYLHGEPEEAILEILTLAQSGGAQLPVKKAAPIEKLDDLPEYDHGLFNIEFEKQTQYLPTLPIPNYTLSIGRSCPACHDFNVFGDGIGCRICRSKGTVPRLRSPQNVSDSIYRLSGSHGTGGIGSLFFHDTHLAPKDWLESLALDWMGTIRPIPFFMPLDARAILTDPSVVTKLFKVGLRWVGFNVVSGSKGSRKLLGCPTTLEEDLQALQVLRANRVNIWLRAQVGIPLETSSDFERTDTVCREAKAAKLSVEFFSPSPIHPIYDWCEKEKHFGARNPPPNSPDPWIKGVDYETLARRLRAWEGSYISPIIVLPVEVPPGLKRAQESTPSSTTTTSGLAPSDVVTPQKIAPAQAPPAPEPTGVRTQIDGLLKKGPAKTKVTVICCSYNRPVFLREAVTSIFEQTFKDWELIVVDDASSDPGVIEYLKHKEANYSNVRVIWHKRNVNNIAASWNEALEISVGEYVCLLDDDNKKHSDFLQELVKELDARPDKDGVYCRSMVFHAGREDSTPRGRTGDFTLKQELEGNFIDSGELLFRKNLVERIGWFDERCKACEDWDFVCRATAFSSGFAFVDKILTDYRAHDQNRLHTSIELGAPACAELLRSKHNGRPFKKLVRVVSPSTDRLTASQLQVISGIKAGLQRIPFVQILNGASDDYVCDLVFAVAPFMLHGPEIEGMCRRISDISPKPILATLHMEDPQAIMANCRLLGQADWIVANDFCAMRWYAEKLVKDGQPAKAKKILAWNSLGVSELALSVFREQTQDRPIDVLMLGYPYPSRAQFMRDFMKDAPSNWSVRAVGDGWERSLPGLAGRRVVCLPTQPEQETARLLTQTKVVLLTHRQKTDIGGFPVIPPESLHRGFMEAASGCEVLVDLDRPFGEGRLKFHRFKDAKTAVSLAWGILNKKTPTHAQYNTPIAQDECSFRHRLTRILHCIFSERYNVAVP